METNIFDEFLDGFLDWEVALFGLKFLKVGKSLISKIVRWISKEDVPLELGSPQPYF